MKRLSIIFSLIFIIIPLILLAWLLMTESGLQWSYNQAKPYLPAELSIQQLHGKLIGPISFHNVEFSQPTAQIQTQQITFDWQPLSLLAANIDISQLHIQTLNVTLAATENQQVSKPTAITLPEINLPWRLSLNNVQLNDLNLQQGEQAFAVKQIKLNASSLFSQLDIHEFSLISDILNLDIKGELQLSHRYRHDLEFNWQASLPSAALLKADGQIKGNIKSTRIRQNLQGALEMTLDAQLSNLLQQLNWNAQIQLSQFDAQQLNPQWPALHGTLAMQAEGDLSSAILSGKLAGTYPELGPFDASFKLQRLSSNTLLIDQLTVQAPENNSQLNVKGQWVPGEHGGDAQLTLDWKNLLWPLQGPATINSKNGHGELAGNLHRYQMNITSDSLLPAYAIDSLNINATGDLNGIELQSLKLNALKGQTTASGQFNWSPALSWQAKISATNIDPSSRFTQWPGQINAQLTTSGNMQNQQLLADANITQLEGQLRGYPVSAQSILSWRNNGLDINLFSAQSANSKLNIKGRAAEQLKLDWDINSADLAEVYPQAEGKLQAEGQLSGPRNAPTINAKISAKALSIPEYKIGNINGQLAVDLSAWKQIDIQLAAQDVQFQAYKIQSIGIEADTQQIQLKLDSADANAHVKLLGKTEKNAWHGHIEQLSIQSKRFSNWQLKSPAKLNLSENNLLLETLCLQNNETASFCASIKQHDKTWLSQINMLQLPLQLASPWLPADLTLDGSIDANADLQLKHPQQLHGKLQLQLNTGSISYPLLEGERERWKYHGGKLEISLNEQGIKATSDIAMSNGDHLKINAELAGAQLLSLNQQSQLFRADAQLSVHDLGLIEAFNPEIQDLKGELAINVSAQGSLAHPLLSGQAKLVNSSLRIPRLGLSINQINLLAKSNAEDKLQFQLDAHSGEGKLQIQGHTTLDTMAGWPTEISIKGEQFEVSSIPEARIEVTPDLQVSVKHRSVNINGKVHIPYAKLQPKDVTTAANVSGDSVIIGNEQVIDEKWLVTTRVRLTLGERVNFFGFGFEGRFAGNLLLLDEPGQLTTASGEISIPEGRYRAYGQRLDVEHGRLLYTGGPISNPGLDLRAVRHTNNVVAGLKVRGSLNQPQMELFSIPAMGQTDALSYLLLGRPMENTSDEDGAMMAKAALALGLSEGDQLARILGDRFGLDEMRVESSDKGDQASLVVGRYLSPKLYVSYGIGLIEAINTISLRYQISEKWQVKAESGEYTGADLLYTIER